MAEHQSYPELQSFPTHQSFRGHPLSAAALAVQVVVRDAVLVAAVAAVVRAAVLSTATLSRKLSAIAADVDRVATVDHADSIHVVPTGADARRQLGKTAGLAKSA